MLVMRTIENLAYSVGELVRSQEPFGLYDLALGVNPPRLDRVEPRALLRKQATHDPHAAPALFDATVVATEPPPDLLGDVPGGVVPDEKQDLLADLFEPFGAPRKEPRRYGRNRPAVHEPDPRLIDLRKADPVAGDGLRLRVVFGDRALEEARLGVLLGPGAHKVEIGRASCRERV